MAFKKGEPRPSNAGRKVGASNKLTRDIREMILGALSAVGGQAYLVKQAELNPVAFMSLLGKIMPTQITATVEREITELTREELTAMIRDARGKLAQDGDEPPQVH